MPCAMRIGYGYDIHRLERLPPEGTGRRFILGGVEINHELGPVGKTDADVLLHAITDALLGAAAIGSMGTLFPTRDPRRVSGDSTVFMDEASRQIQEQGWLIGNVDATVILESPQIAPYLDVIRSQLARLLSLEPQQVSVKAKTHERLDALGSGIGIEAHAVVLLYRTA